MNTAQNPPMDSERRKADLPSGDASTVNAFDNLVLSVFGLMLFGVLIWFSVGP